MKGKGTRGKGKGWKGKGKVRQGRKEIKETEQNKIEEREGGKKKERMERN